MNLITNNVDGGEVSGQFLIVSTFGRVKILKVDTSQSRLNDYFAPQAVKFWKFNKEKPVSKNSFKNPV